MNEAKLDPRTPVLVGWAAVSQRQDDPLAAREPLALMIGAARAAGSASLLAGVEAVAVPRGRWRYRDPGRAIAEAIGAPAATTLLAHVGILQQSLIGDACRRIRDGEIDTALVVGGDAGRRLQRARIAGIRFEDSQQGSDPDVVLTAEEELLHPAELRAGLDMAVGSYALLGSAFRAARGEDVDGHRSRLAGLYAGLSRIAAENPEAWTRETLDAGTIREPSRRNPMQAFPYARLHCADWSVDQAAALAFCSAGRARALGLDPARWMFPVASTEANHMAQVSTRADLARCAGAALAGRAALAAGGLAIAEVELIELYSCFPAAIDIVAAELGVPEGRPLSVTGGMAMAGGPFNNTVLQATARMANLLAGRAGRGQAATGLVGSVSGLLTKQGFGLWSSRPIGGFQHADVTAETARRTRAVPVAMEFSGPARVAAATVLCEKGIPMKAVVVADTGDGRRVVAQSGQPAAMARIGSDGLVGASIVVRDGHAFALD